MLRWLRYFQVLLLWLCLCRTIRAFTIKAIKTSALELHGTKSAFPSSYSPLTPAVFGDVAFGMVTFGGIVNPVLITGIIQ